MESPCCQVNKHGHAFSHVPKISQTLSGVKPLPACIQAAFSHMLMCAQSPTTLCLQTAEIGATARAPAERTMKRGIGMGYGIILTAYLTVSITGRHTTSGSPCWCIHGILALLNRYYRRLQSWEIAPCKRCAWVPVL